MNIANQLTQVNTTKQEIKTAIENKGVSMTGIPFTSYPSKINEITGGGDVPDTYTRPSNWRTMPTVSASEQKIVGLFYVKDLGDINTELVFSVNGAYTVDWGDSTSNNYADGAKASHSYSYASIDNSYIVEPGIKQVIVTITPQAGQNLTTFVATNYYDGITFYLNTNWLEFIISMPNSASIQFGSTSYINSSIKSIKILSIKDNTSLGFKGLTSVEQIDIPSTFIAPVNLTSLFQGCYSLKVVPLFNTVNVNTIDVMFEQCRSIKSIPEYNFLKVNSAVSAFSNCVSLESFNHTNLPELTNANTMFNYCVSLKSIAECSTPKLNTMNATFFHCESLREMPLWNTGLVTNMGNCWSYCYSMKKVAELDFSKVTTIQSNYDGLFRDCTSLDKLPESLKYLPVGLTAPLGSFAGCNSVTYIPEFVNTSQWTQIHTPIYNVGIFHNLYSVNEFPALNLTNVTSGGYIGGNNYNLLRSKLYNVKVSHTYANSRLDQIAINEVIENLGTPSASQTLTISSTPGAVRNATISRSCTTTAGSTTVSNANTTGITVGMQVTGTGITNSRAVTLTDAGDLVTLVGHGLPNGKRVSFNSITTTTGIAIYNLYYVVNATTDTFQLSLTQGGTPIALTNNGTGTIIYQTLVIAIEPNVSVTVDVPASISGTSNLAYRNLNTQIAVMKRWTVSG